MHFRFKPRRNPGSQSQHRSVNRTAVIRMQVLTSRFNRYAAAGLFGSKRAPRSVPDNSRGAEVRLREHSGADSRLRAPRVSAMSAHSVVRRPETGGGRVGLCVPRAAWGALCAEPACRCEAIGLGRGRCECGRHREGSAKGARTVNWTAMSAGDRLPGTVAAQASEPCFEGIYSRARRNIPLKSRRSAGTRRRSLPVDRSGRAWPAHRPGGSRHDRQECRIVPCVPIRFTHTHTRGRLCT